MAGGAKSVADRRAWPLLGGIDSRRAATAAPRGAKGSTAMARDSATCSSPVSVVLGVVPGVVTGVDPGRRPRPRRARLRRRNRSRREAPSRRARCAGASRIALSVWPCSSKSSAAASTLASRLRRGPGGRFPLPLMFARDGDGRSRQAVPRAARRRSSRARQGDRDKPSVPSGQMPHATARRRGGYRAVHARFVARFRERVAHACALRGRGRGRRGEGRARGCSVCVRENPRGETRGLFSADPGPSVFPRKAAIGQKKRFFEISRWGCPNFKDLSEVRFESVRSHVQPASGCSLNSCNFLRSYPHQLTARRRPRARLGRRRPRPRRAPPRGGSELGTLLVARRGQTLQAPQNHV